MLKEASGNSSECPKAKKLVASDLERKKRGRRGKYIRNDIEKIFCCTVD